MTIIEHERESFTQVRAILTKNMTCYHILGNGNGKGTGNL